MNPKKLSVILILVGVTILLLSVVWFFAAYASALDTMSRYGNKDVTMQMMACLYSTPPICQGASFLGGGPSYSPVIFWLGVVSLLTGVIVVFALTKQAQTTEESAGRADGVMVSDQLLGFIAKTKYTRYTYILFLVGAGGGLLFPPLAIAALLGFVLAMLGYVLYPQQLSSLDKNHLAALSLVYIVATLMLFLAMGSAWFYLIALPQLVVFYIGFNSFRLGRMISPQNLKEEAILAFKPVRERFSQGGKS